jgi:hypothetical protein
MWWRRSWFSLKGKAGIPGQTEGRPATSIGPRVLPVGSLQQRDDEWAISRRYMSLESLSALSDDPVLRLPAVAA